MNSATLFVISLIPLALGNELTKEFSPLLLLLLAANGFRVLHAKRDTFYLVTPASLVFFYVTLSLALGAWAFHNGWVAVEKNLRDYWDWQWMHVTLTVTMLSLSIVAFVEHRFQARYELRRDLPFPQPPRFSMVIASAILIPFFFLPLDLDAIGGSGDLSIMPKTILAMFAILATQRLDGHRARLVIYLSLILIFSTFSIADKREAIFLAFPALYLELLRTRRPLTPKMLGGLSLLGVALATLIIAMSIARGYGDFGEFSNLSDTLWYIVPYISSDKFLEKFFANIEVNYFFFHGLNSMEMIIDLPSQAALGSTLVKPLLIALPRSIAPWKPDSIIGLYTSAYDPAIREIGGSWPISLFSEFFWNFHLAAPLAALAFALILGRLQISLLGEPLRRQFFKLAFLLFCYMHLITLTRGSGVDQYCVYVLLGGIFILACSAVHRVGARACGGRQTALI